MTILEQDGREWWPADYMDEGMPPGRPTPDAWIVPFGCKEGVGHTVASPYNHDLREEAEREWPYKLLPNGGRVNFCFYDDLGTVEVTINPDGTFEPHGAVHPEASWFYDDDERGEDCACGDALEEFTKLYLEETPITEPKRVTVGMGNWSDSIAFSVKIEGDVVSLEQAGSVNFPISDAALDDRLAILGTSGSGKTYLTTTAMERLLKMQARVVGVDPLGVMWGLRLKADGQTPSGFNLPIFGGSHGDLPLTEHAGALIGETVATMRESCIIDLSDLPTKAAERRFMTAFLESIYRHTNPANGDPYHLIIDEADRFAPQKPPAGDETMLNRMEEIVRRGRVKGFIPWLITQRPAVLNKNVLSQADGLVLLKLTSSQDRDQVGAWIEGQADRAKGKEILGALPAMQLGQGTIWIPGRGILETVQFPKKATFDSSRAPKRGEKRSTTTLKPLNIDALKGKLSKVEAETKENDPKTLKAALATANAELAKLRKPATSASNAVGKSNTADFKAQELAMILARAEGWSEGYVAGDRDGFARGAEVALSQGFQTLQTSMKAFTGVEFTPPRRIPAPPRSPSSGATSSISAPVSPSKPAAAVVPPRSAPPEGMLEGPLQRIVDAIRWWNVFGIEEPTHQQAAFMANYVPGSGTWSRYLSALRSGGYLQPRGPLKLTAGGVIAARDPDDAPTAERLREIVLGKIDTPLARILKPLIEFYPEELSHEDLAQKAGYEPGSGTWSRYLSSLRSLDLIEKRGPLKAQEWLFP